MLTITESSDSEPVGVPESDFWKNLFHWCALAAGFLAASEGRLDDSAYVRELAYRWYEEGAFRDRVRLPDLTDST